MDKIIEKCIAETIDDSQKERLREEREIFIMIRNDKYVVKHTGATKEMVMHHWYFKNREKRCFWTPTRIQTCRYICAVQIFKIVYVVEHIISLIDSVLYILDKTDAWTHPRNMSIEMKQLFTKQTMIPSLLRQKEFLKGLIEVFMDNRWWSFVGIGDFELKYNMDMSLLYGQNFDLYQDIKKRAVSDLYFMGCFHIISCQHSFIKDSIPHYRERMDILYILYPFHPMSVLEKWIQDRRYWDLMTEDENEMVLAHRLLPYPNHFVCYPKRPVHVQKKITFALGFPYRYMIQNESVDGSL